MSQTFFIRQTLYHIVSVCAAGEFVVKGKFFFLFYVKHIAIHVKKKVNSTTNAKKNTKVHKNKIAILVVWWLGCNIRCVVLTRFSIIQLIPCYDGKRVKMLEFRCCRTLVLSFFRNFLLLDCCFHSYIFLRLKLLHALIFCSLSLFKSESYSF